MNWSRWVWMIDLWCVVHRSRGEGAANRARGHEQSLFSAVPWLSWHAGHRPGPSLRFRSDGSATRVSVPGPVRSVAVSMTPPVQVIEGRSGSPRIAVTPGVDGWSRGFQGLRRAVRPPSPSSIRQSCSGRIGSDCPRFATLQAADASRWKSSVCGSGCRTPCDGGRINHIVLYIMVTCSSQSGEVAKR